MSHQRKIILCNEHGLFLWCYCCCWSDYFPKVIFFCRKIISNHDYFLFFWESLPHKSKFTQNYLYIHFWLIFHVPEVISTNFNHKQNEILAHTSQVHLFLILSHPFSHEDINGPILTQITIFSAQQLSKLTKLWLLLFDTTLNRNTFCYCTSPALKYRCFLVVNFKRLTVLLRQ